MPNKLHKRQYIAENALLHVAPLARAAAVGYGVILNSMHMCLVQNLPCQKDAHGWQIDIPTTLSNLPLCYVNSPLCQNSHPPASLAKRFCNFSNFGRFTASMSRFLKRIAPNSADCFSPRETVLTDVKSGFIPPLLDPFRVRGRGLFLAQSQLNAPAKGCAHV